MRRRQLIGFASAAAMASGAPPAQALSPSVIGFLSLFTREAVRTPFEAFLSGLAAGGYDVGRNAEIDYGWADGVVEKLPLLAAQLVRRNPAVIVAAGGNFSAEAAKAATSTIPIVFTAVSDPVRAGLVASFNKPGGNVTGVSILSHELDAKRLDLLQEMIPAARVVGALLNPKNPTAAVQRANLESAGAALGGRTLVIEQAGTEIEISGAIARLVERGATALLVGADPFFTQQRLRIVDVARQHVLPGMYQWRQFVEAGGLASYGPDFSDAYRQSGMYVARILKGEKPADLPVLQPTRFQLVLNLKVGREFGIDFNSSSLARADEVID